jgi:hypothetical protein
MSAANLRDMLIYDSEEKAVKKVPAFDYGFHQCSGSGTGSVGIVCIWASRIRIFKYEARIRILLSPSKNRKKKIDSKLFFMAFIFEKQSLCTGTFKK